VALVDRTTAIERLPRAYAIALRIAELGGDHTTIARALEVPVESVPGLLAIGESKLAAALASGEPPGGGDKAQAAK
jgi:hypothetical protein